MSLLKVLEHYEIELNSQNKTCCPFHQEKSPSFSVDFDRQFFYCFGCGAGSDAVDFVKLKEGVGFKEALKIVSEITGMKEEEILDKKEKEDKQEKVVPLSKEFIEDFYSKTTYNSKNYRGIKDEYRKFFGHRTKLDERGNVIAQYYPETIEDKLTGYKCRNHPKDFSYGKIGVTGSKCQLSGQVKFKSAGKFCVIVAGEEDKVAAYQMFRENQIERNQGGYEAIPVVSPTTGESSSLKQIAAQYDWFDMFENIIIGMDNDKVGIAAAYKIAEVLPKDKVKIATWSGKDPNEMLQKGQQKQFIRDFWNAKEYIKTGIKSSIGLVDEALEFLEKPRISLPPYMHRLQTMCGGGKESGILQGSIVNLIADTSTGKTTHVNNIVYHLMFNAPERPGIVSLEATAGQYTLDILSLHLKENLLRKGWDNEEIRQYLLREDVAERYKDLLEDEDGRERFNIIDERSGSIKSLEKQMERMYSKNGTRIFVIDVLSDILRGTSSDLQEDHMSWQKNFIKEGVTIFNVLHTRKTPPDPKGNKRRITEYDALGSSTFPQSAHINILMERDKLSDDLIDKNTTSVWMSKCRGGDTGECGGWYYDVPTRSCYDLEDFKTQQAKLFEEESRKEED